MRHLFLTMVIASITLAACGNKKPESNKNTVAVSNSSATNGTAKGSELLTKAVFIQKIWDFTKSPNEWKYLGSKPAIIDFYADWCGPCKLAGPVLEEVGTQFAGKIQIYKINTDQERELAQVFGITGIPAFLYIPVSGRPVMMSGIGRSKEETRKMFVDNIEKYLSVKK